MAQVISRPQVVGSLTAMAAIVAPAESAHVLEQNSVRPHGIRDPGSTRELALDGLGARSGSQPPLSVPVAMSLLYDDALGWRPRIFSDRR
ncbi:hypothetical protein AWC22_16790 [Mycobacterium riyadhense]|uniref:Uncharacterized protein n=1 Tax=Mycobacterium riyadhense TaxID=486698 RepID=A0A1X2CZG2_9MYCO|nr:hypothetical protein AWC22_16790 [Mycobacterium riyadhense]